MSLQANSGRLLWKISLKIRKNIDLCKLSDKNNTAKSEVYFQDVINECLSKHKITGLKCRFLWEKGYLINAKAVRAGMFKDSYGVVLNHGVIQVLFDSSFKISNNRIDKNNYVIPDYGIFNPNQNSSSGFVRGERVYTQTHTCIAFLILFFFVNHELGHIVSGHSREEDVLKGIQGQAKEYVADLFAFDETFDKGISVFGYENTDIIAYALYYLCDLFREQREMTNVYFPDRSFLGFVHRIYRRIKLHKKKKETPKNQLDENEEIAENHPDPLVRLYYLFERLKQKLDEEECTLSSCEKENICVLCRKLFEDAHSLDEEKEWLKNNYEKEQVDKIEEKIGEIEDRYNSYQ